jgi:O-antigen/teichoic acid export membrane protein
VQLSKLIYKQVTWRGLSIASSFLLNVLFARFLGADAAGNVLYQFAILSLVIQFAGFSAETGVAYHAARRDIPAPRLLGFSLIWSFLAAIVSGAGFIMYQLQFPDRDFSVTLSTVFVLGNMLISFGNAYCFSMFRFVLPGAAAVFVNLLVSFVLWTNYIWRYLQLTNESLWYGTYLLHGLLLFFFILAYHDRPRISFRITGEQVKNVLRYSAFAFAANLVYLLVTRVDYFFIKQFCTPAELGNYTQVSRIAQMLFLLPSMVSTVLFPMTASGTSGLKADPVDRVSSVLLAINGGVCVVLTITGYWFFPLLFGETYTGMYLPFLLLIPGIMSVTLLYPHAAYLAGKNKVTVNIKGGLLALLIIIPADIILIPRFGIEAAAAISSAGYIAYAAFVLRVARSNAVNEVGV